MKKLPPPSAKYLNAVASSSRFDANESVVVARALEHVEKKVLEVIYAELRALRYVPQIGGIDPGAKTYTWPLLDFVGEAARSSGRGKDLPRVDASLTENYSAIESYGAAYGYTTHELREIALAASRGYSIALDTMRAKKVAEVIARKIDKVIAFGDTDNANIKGFLNNSLVSIVAAAGVWSGLTADQLLDELFALANASLIVSKETIDADTILLPTAQWLLVSRKPVGTNAERSVLAYFMETMRAAGRNIQVASWPLLATAGAGSVARAVAYKRDEDVAGAVVPLPFSSEPAQAKGLEFEVPCESRCGGTVVKQPMGMVYRDGL